MAIGAAPVSKPHAALGMGDGGVGVPVGSGTVDDAAEGDANGTTEPEFDALEAETTGLAGMDGPVDADR
jgi:hypothetical protein